MIENLVGKTLAERYHILELIGTGGMASVYKARCELLKRDVAVKVLRDSVKDDEMALKCFKQEAQAAAQLCHNNIVQVFDVGEVDGMDYMVMELVEGVTLKKYIKEQGALPWRDACDFAVQIAQALEAAHAKGLVHRDIKPQNILTTEDKVLKVADFGIAKAANSETLMVTDNNAMGSAHYISPEQARGGFTDARSDIYSLGIVLFEMLTGKVPFNGESPISVALMHIEKQPPSVLDFNADVPEDVAAIVAKAITKEQVGRYQSATEMIFDLTAVLENRPVDIQYVDGDEDAFDATKRFGEEGADIKQIKKNKKKIKKAKTPQEKKADRIATILGIITVIVLVFAAYGVWTFVTSETEAVTVPEFVNMPIEEAYRLAEERGIVLNELKSDVSDEIPKDYVSWQDPVSGTKIMPEETVFIIVSEGASLGDISIPDVSGMSYEIARQIITEEGLEYITEEMPSLDVPRGYVISQSPKRDTKVSEGHTVTLFVSAGSPTTEELPSEIPVPALIGKSQEEAKVVCDEYGLAFSAMQVTDTRPYGTVLKQSPLPGTPSGKGTQVTVIISSGTGGESTPTAEPTGEDNTQETVEDQIKTKEFTYEIKGKNNSTEPVKVKITVDGDTVYCNQFATSETKLEIGGKEAILTQTTDYPYNGKITLNYSGEPMTLYVRIPDWCVEYEGDTENGFARFELSDGDSVTVDLPIEIHFIEANPYAQDNSGRYAVQRGPIVYCMEEIDNGENLRDITLLENSEKKVVCEEGIPAPVIYMGAERRPATNQLYSIKNDERVSFTARLIPYFAFANREVSDMLVWTMVK